MRGVWTSWPALAALAIAGLAGCGDDEARPSKATPLPPGGACEPGQRLVGEACVAAGVQDDGCAAGELARDDGSCQPAGVPPESCGKGFEPDGADGCAPILPAKPCPPGSFAIPGETACHEVLACGSGRWGDIPLGANVEYVDGNDTGGASDGTEAHPWTTIQAAIDAADTGGVVAIAEGTYGEDVTIYQKTLTLSGRCPAKVALVGTGVAFAALQILDADETVIRGIAVAGPQLGIGLSGSKDVRLESIWVHDAAVLGIDLERDLGTTSATVVGSLVEGTGEAGIAAVGSEMHVEASSVRDTKPRADLTAGMGVYAADDETGGATLTVDTCVIERNHMQGVLVIGSKATVESTLVRDNLPQASNQELGRGVDVEAGIAGPRRGELTLRSSVVTGNHDVGVVAIGSTAIVEWTVVRDTQSQASDSGAGQGLGAEVDPKTLDPADITVRGSLIERNHGVGVQLGASKGLFEATIIRDTQPQPDGSRGAGFEAQGDVPPGVLADATLRGCVVSGNRGVAIGMLGANGTLSAIVARDTQAQLSDLHFGRGVEIHGMSTPITVNVDSSLVSGNLEGGIIVFAANANIVGTKVGQTSASASDGNLGDAIIPFGGGEVAIAGCMLEDSARAGIGNAGSVVKLGTTRLECNPIQLNAETAGTNDQAGTFQDVGGNLCGCGGTRESCRVMSSHLAPPEALPGPPR